MELSAVGDGGRNEDEVDPFLVRRAIGTENRTFLGQYFGILMALLASFFFSVSFLIMKILGQDYSYTPNGTAVLFNLGVVLPCVPAMVYHERGPGSTHRNSLKKDFWPISDPSKRNTLAILWLQGGLQGFSVLLRSQSLLYIPVADMTVIVFSSPVVVAVLAHFILKEKCALLPILIAFLTLGGIFLMMKPPLLTGKESFDTNTLTGSGFALGALFALSLKFVVTRSIKEANFLTMTFFLGTCGLILSLPFFLCLDNWDSIVPKSLVEVFLVLGLLLAFCSIASINLALKSENAATVALVRSLDVIFAFLLQFLVLGVIPDALSAIGASLVVFGVLVTTGRKWLFELHFEHKLRKRLSCLLI